MTSALIASAPVQRLLDRASGLDQDGGDPRLKAITRDLLQAIMATIETHDISESEFWQALSFLQQGAPEFGLIAPGVGLEHFLDLYMDHKDAQAGLAGGTPRTIEGPLYVAGAPLVDSGAHLNDDGEPGERLEMNGSITGPDGAAVKGAVLHVWHANHLGNYSHFDPAQSTFNNRRRIRVGDDGRYAFSTVMPKGYSVPPGGATERYMAALGRHGDRPAHVHFFIEAPGFRTLTTQINFGDDPLAHDDFAFGTREGLLPVPDRSGNVARVVFDFQLVAAATEAESGFSARPRAAA